jgi:hypothetical protein
MKTFSTNLLAIVLVAGTLGTACKKDNHSSTKSSTQTSFGLKADNAVVPLNASGTQSLATVSSAASSITWTSAIANVTAFKLEAKKRNTEIEITSKNLTNVNLFSPAPAFVSALIDTGTYTEIEVKALLTKSSGANIPLTLKGAFTDAGGNITPIEFDFNDNAFIKAEVKNVTFTAAHNLATTITLHLNKLLTGVAAGEISSATLTNGTLVISSSSNSAIYTKIVNNLANSGESEGFDDHGGNDDHGNDDHGSDG